MQALAFSMADSCTPRAVDWSVTSLLTDDQAIDSKPYLSRRGSEKFLRKSRSNNGPLKAMSHGMATRSLTLLVSVVCLSISIISASTDEYVNDDLSAVFMPYYPKDQLGKEVSAIRNVTRYRTLDGRKFSRADNPYCIYYAVYNFAPEPMWQDLVQAFLKARSSGVKVQMLVDAHQLNSFKVDNWNKGLKVLIDAGLKYSPTQLNLTLAEQEEYELIGINTSLRGNGLMHLKTRIFKWEDQQSKQHSVVMTGSFNPEIGPVSTIVCLRFRGIH